MQDITFEYTIRRSVRIDRKLLNATLEAVRDRLLSHDINGGDRKLDMRTVCETETKCGTAACIGGWASIFILGFEVGKNGENGDIVHRLFEQLLHVGTHGLYNLFYEYSNTANYNEPNVAATAIQRYLDGKEPWPKGKMPDVLRYKRPRAAKVTKVTKTAKTAKTAKKK